MGKDAQVHLMKQTSFKVLVESRGSVWCWGGAPKYTYVEIPVLGIL